jgi:hypothetical protein
MSYPNEWTQEEYLQNKKELQKSGVEVVLVDTILSPIEKANTVIYNPYELNKNPKGTVFVFYCYSGNGTLKRLAEYKKKFPDYHCISLKGGRAYWRKNMMDFD